MFSEELFSFLVTDSHAPNVAFSVRVNVYRTTVTLKMPIGCAKKVSFAGTSLVHKYVLTAVSGDLRVPLVLFNNLRRSCLTHSYECDRIEGLWRLQLLTQTNVIIANKGQRVSF